MDMGARPSWLVEECPAWCTREHHEEDHPEDRRHQSPASIMSMDVPTTAIPAGTTQTVEVAVYLDQPVAQPVRWLRVESVDSSRVRLALATGSTSGMVELMIEVLARLEEA